jgi:ribose 5-phosphate isomerase A
MTERETLKKEAATKAVDFIESGMIVGLGSGTTAKYAVIEIGNRIKNGTLKNIFGIPTSKATKQLAEKNGIPLTDFNKVNEIDLTIDGADEVDKNLNLIKGGGGALLHEKIVAQASRKEIIIVDDSKLSEKLCERFVLPIEVVPFAAELEKRYLEELGAKVSLRKRNSGKIFITEEKNYILDAKFKPLEKPGELADMLEKRAGIVVHGLFIALANMVISAGKNGIKILNSLEQ